MKFQAAARAIRGSKDTQEDAWRVYDAKGGDAGEIAASDAGVTLSGGGLLLVADGIGGHYGGDVAAPVFARVMAGSLRTLGVAPDQPIKPAIGVSETEEVAVKESM